MLLQIDGSLFHWCQGPGAKTVLMGAIDDATGKIVFLLFRPSEDQIGYLLLLRTVAQQYGLPMSIYHDRHTCTWSQRPPMGTRRRRSAGVRFCAHRSSQLWRKNTRPMAGGADAHEPDPTVGLVRVMTELGIEPIPAYSPQAKGRIERLWGTLQDRLTKELRLAGLTTLEAANAYLPGYIARYNERFAHAPQDPDSAWVPLPEDLDTNYYFARRETRTVRADHCISFAGQTLQLLPAAKAPSLVHQKVTVHVVPAGEIHLYHGKHPIAHRQVSVAEVALAVPDSSPLPAKTPDPRAAARRRGWLYAQR